MERPWNLEYVRERDDADNSLQLVDDDQPMHLHSHDRLQDAEERVCFATLTHALEPLQHTALPFSN